MKAQRENLDLWREALGDDASIVWNGIREDMAPPMQRIERVGAAVWPRQWLLAAIVAVVAISGTWNFLLLRELESTRTAVLLSGLTEDSASRRLATLHRLRSDSLSPDAVAVLKDVVRLSEDPNIQLAALDLLLDRGVLKDDVEVRELLDSVKHNSHFIDSAIRARFIKT